MNNQDIVCYCSNVTKGEIIEAMKKGAKTFDEVSEMTGACTKGECETLSPRGTCCSPIILQVMEEYLNEKK